MHGSTSHKGLENIVYSRSKCFSLRIFKRTKMNTFLDVKKRKNFNKSENFYSSLFCYFLNLLKNKLAQVEHNMSHLTWTRQLYNRKILWVMNERVYFKSKYQELLPDNYNNLCYILALWNSFTEWSQTLLGLSAKWRNVATHFMFVSKLFANKRAYINFLTSYV